MLTIAFFLAFFLLLFFPLATYVLFWYEGGNSPYRSLLHQESKGKTASWILKGLFSSLWSQVLILLFFPLGWFKPLWKARAEEDSTFPPVVLIHGLYHNASAWFLFCRWLRRAGVKRIHLITYSSWRHTFEEIEEQVAQRLAEISAFEGNEPVLLVGHSLGGLLAKAFAGKTGDPAGPAVRGIITLGTPFKGSKTTVFATGKLARSIGCGSDLITRLEAIDVPSSTPCAALYSPVDNLVLPSESLRAAPEAWAQEKTAPISHAACLYHKPTFKKALNHLSQFAEKTIQQRD